MSLVYTLKQQCLTTVQDAAGDWLIEGGQVFNVDKKQVGEYSSVMRQSCGTRQQNTAMLWMTLFLGSAKPPESMTLHGARDMGSGDETGSVSAEFPAATYIGKPFKRAGSTLTIA